MPRRSQSPLGPSPAAEAEGLGERAKAALRQAHELETGGHVDSAVEALCRFGRADARHLWALEDAREGPGATLCPEAYPRARQRMWNAVDAAIRPSTHQSGGEKVMAFGCLALVAAPFLGAVVALVLAASGRTELLGEPPGGVALKAALIGLAIAIVAGYLLGNARRRRALGQRGVFARARVSGSTLREVLSGDTRKINCLVDLTVHHGAGSFARTLRLARETAIAAGDYPCLIDPEAPAAAVVYHWGDDKG